MPLYEWMCQFDEELEYDEWSTRYSDLVDCVGAIAADRVAASAHGPALSEAWREGWNAQTAWRNQFNDPAMGWDDLVFPQDPYADKT